jgi:uncharacterized 2Fe-2S/4Fe-4S cluster protein (DUF4445 family)
VAGAFGSAIHPASAVAIGLFPALPRRRFTGVGNVGGLGACLYQASPGERGRAEALARSMRHLDLTALRDYQDLFLRRLRLEEE